MEAINDLHTRICCLEKELGETANVLAEKEKMIQDLHHNQEIVEKRIANCRHAMTKNEKILRKREEELHHLLHEHRQAEGVLFVQARTLRSLTQLIVQTHDDFQNSSTILRRRMEGMWKELQASGCYGQQRVALSRTLSQNKAVWKENEVNRGLYHTQTTSVYKELIRAEEHELSHLLTQLNEANALHTVLPPTRPALQYLAPQYPPLPSPSVVTPIETTPEEVVNHMEVAANQIVVPSNASSAVLPIGFEKETNRTYQYSENSPSNLLVSMHTMEQNRVHTRFTSYELSVSPWFHEVKKRHMDIYTLYEPSADTNSNHS
eukprot:scaffold997_cov250-Ochromonas_danica.AAC.7